MKHADEMNNIQDYMLYATSLCRDCVAKIFSEHEQDKSAVDATLKKLFSYFSQRSQSVAHLVSFDYAWDAEMILRAAFETAAKIWLICLSTSQEREKLVEEFWGIRTQIHNRQRARKTNLAKKLFLSANQPDDVNVFEALEDEKEFEHDGVNKKIRKGIEQRWSFSGIIAFLESNHPSEFPLKYLSSFLHGYSNASHLIHADDCALDLMLDRELREPEELVLLKCAHYTRIWGDLVGLWYVSTTALGFMFGKKIQEETHNAFKQFFELSAPVNERFNMSQQEFYDNWKQKNNSEY